VIAGTTLTRRSLSDPTSISLTQTCTNVSVGADMVVMNDEVYVAATDGVVTKIDYDGTPIATWTAPNRGAGVPGVYLPLMASAVGDSLLYVFPKDEMAYAIKTSNMTTSGTWTYGAADTNCGPAFMSFDGNRRSGVIYTPAGKKIYKLTEGSGAPTWTYAIPGDSCLSGPVGYNGKVYFGTKDSSYYATPMAAAARRS
jgi:outer membrane protein assembly factor BamB